MSFAGKSVTQPSKWGPGVSEPSVELLNSLGVHLESYDIVWYAMGYTYKVMCKYMHVGEVSQVSGRARMLVYPFELLRESALAGVEYVEGEDTFLRGLRLFQRVGDYVEAHGLPRGLTGDALSLFWLVLGWDRTQHTETFDDVLALTRVLADGVGRGVVVDANSILELVNYGLAPSEMASVVSSELVAQVSFDMLLQLCPDKVSLLAAATLGVLS
jgi:hypothetical protein